MLESPAPDRRDPPDVSAPASPRTISAAEAQSAFRSDTPIHLTFPYKGSEITAFSTLLGCKHGRFLLVDQPMHEGNGLGTQSGVSCVARLLADGRVLGFVAQVLRSQFSPDPVVFLSYPSAVQEVALRRHERVQVNLPSVVRIGAATERRPVVVVDLSASGCGLLLEELATGVEVGTSVEVFLPLPGVAGVKLLKGVIRAVRKQRRATGREATFLGIQIAGGQEDAELAGIIQRISSGRSGSP